MVPQRYHTVAIVVFIHHIQNLPPPLALFMPHFPLTVLSLVHYRHLRPLPEVVSAALYQPNKGLFLHHQISQCTQNLPLQLDSRQEEKFQVLFTVQKVHDVMKTPLEADIRPNISSRIPCLSKLLLKLVHWFPTKIHPHRHPSFFKAVNRGTKFLFLVGEERSCITQPSTFLLSDLSSFRFERDLFRKKTIRSTRIDAGPWLTVGRHVNPYPDTSPIRDLIAIDPFRVRSSPEREIANFF